MYTLGNKYLIFISLMAIGLTSFSTIKVNSYENNQLLNMNDSYSKFVLSNESYKKLNLKRDQWFEFYEELQQKTKKISDVEQSENKWIIYLLNNSTSRPITNISYKIGKSNIWVEIFKFSFIFIKS